MGNSARPCSAGISQSYNTGALGRVDTPAADRAEQGGGRPQLARVSGATAPGFGPQQPQAGQLRLVLLQLALRATQALTWENVVSEGRVGPMAYTGVLSADFLVGGTA
jgi:hypothetical protein